LVNNETAVLQHVQYACKFKKKRGEKKARIVLNDRLKSVIPLNMNFIYLPNALIEKSLVQ